MMDPVRARFSPAWGWALAGAVSFPALTLALGYLPTRPLIALAAAVAGVALAAGAAMAALGRGYSARDSARAWAVAYTAGVVLYTVGLELSWPQPDNAVIVQPDGSGGLNGGQEALLLLLSIGVTLILGAALDESHRAAPGKRLQVAAAAATAWALAMLPLPFLFVFGVYATSILGNAIRLGGEVPAHLFGLVCSGALMGVVVGGVAERVMRRWRPLRSHWAT